ncbi:MAG: bifunctional heptose 7-phosphate kinase/heptose 1-phosphate adenyltransferase [Anaerolineae bacterium]
MMDTKRLNELLAGFKRQRILVIGDYFLDKYLQIQGDLGEVSLETGLTAYQVTAINTNPGAAGNVAANVRSLGLEVAAITVLGGDGEGYDLRRRLTELGIDLDGVIDNDQRFTPTYTKPMMHEPDGRIHELSRIDHKNRSPLPVELEDQVLARLNSIVGEVNGVIVTDQVQERNCGIITDRVRARLVELADKRRDIPFVVDSRLRVGEFKHLYLKPNEREAYNALGWSSERPIGIAEASTAGLELGARNGSTVFLTLGPQGILVCDKGRVQRVPAVPVQGPIDIVGAGDSAIAGITSALSAGADPLEAAFVGNLVASVTIKCIGTTGTANQNQVRAALPVWQEGLH